MSKEDLFSKLIELDSVENKTVEIYDAMLQVMEELRKTNLTREESKKIDIFKSNSIIGKTELMIENTSVDDYENLINLRGKLIKALKTKESQVDDQEEKNEARYRSIEELKKHKETLQKYKQNDKKKVSISKRVGLTIKEIADSIQIFMREKDIIQKAKTVIIDSAIGAVGAAAITLAIYAGAHFMFGVPFTLAGLATAAPTLAYIGLSSLLRVLSSKTPFEQYQYLKSDEYKNMIANFNNDNKEELEEIKAIIESKANIRNNDDLLKCNDILIEKYKTLTNKTELQGIKDTLNLRVLDLLRENKDTCKDIINDYEEERNDDKEKYDATNKKLMNINKEIFVLGNSIKEAFNYSKDSFIKSTKIILIAKAILAGIAPNVFAITGIESLSTPIIISAINNLIQIPNYHNKLKFKESNYTGKVKSNSLDKIKEILNGNKEINANLSPALA